MDFCVLIARENTERLFFFPAHLLCCAKACHMMVIRKYLVMREILISKQHRVC